MVKKVLLTNSRFRRECFLGANHKGGTGADRVATQKVSPFNSQFPISDRAVVFAFPMRASNR